MKLTDLYEEKKVITMKIGGKDIELTLTPLSIREGEKYSGSTTMKKRDNVLMKHIVNDISPLFEDDSKQDILKFLTQIKPAIGEMLKMEMLKLLGHDFDSSSDDKKEEQEEIDFDED